MNAPLPFPRKYTAHEAAGILGMSAATLARERAKGHIRAYNAGGRRIYYLDREISAYLERQTDQWDAKSNSQAVSETTGLVSKPDRPSGIAHGSTPQLDRRDAKASALKILTAPTNSLRSGSRSMSSCTVPNRSA